MSAITLLFLVIFILFILPFLTSPFIQVTNSSLVIYNSSFFLLFAFSVFFQAEDGIRDIGVTGVQTCALPILANPRPSPTGRRSRAASHHVPSTSCADGPPAQEPGRGSSGSSTTSASAQNRPGDRKSVV